MNSSETRSDIIFLIGFMGAGKTTIGKEIAAQRNLLFVDLDSVIEFKEGKSIAEIVMEKGIDYFRKKESELLKAMDLDNVIVACGGGTPCFFDNLEWMKSRGKVIFVNTSFESIFSRLKGSDISKRPLLKNIKPAELKEQLHLLYTERLPIYQQATVSFDPIKEQLSDLLLDN